jgi:hypothetical protein
MSRHDFTLPDLTVSRCPKSLTLASPRPLSPTTIKSHAEPRFAHNPNMDFSGNFPDEKNFPSFFDESKRLQSPETPPSPEAASQLAAWMSTVNQFGGETMKTIHDSWKWIWCRPGCEHTQLSVQPMEPSQIHSLLQRVLLHSIDFNFLF